MAADAPPSGASPGPFVPRKVFLFSGHMIDAADRAVPRFPARAVPAAERAIAAKLDELQAGPQDLAISSAACGGDLLFAEAASQRGARLEIYLPFDVPAFLASSVDFAGSAWRSRFEAVASRAVLHLLPHEHPALPNGHDPYESNNRWMLQEAQAHGASRIEFICLWNGEGGDGPGGTAHMFGEVQQRGGRVHWLETNALWR